MTVFGGGERSRTVAAGGTTPQSFSIENDSSPYTGEPFSRGSGGRRNDRCGGGKKPHPALRRHLPRRCKHRSAAPPQAAASARSVATSFLAQPRCWVALGGRTSSTANGPPSPSAEGEGSFALRRGAEERSLRGRQPLSHFLSKMTAPLTQGSLFRRCGTVKNGRCGGGEPHPALRHLPLLRKGKALSRRGGDGRWELSTAGISVVFPRGSSPRRARGRKRACPFR